VGLVGATGESEELGEYPDLLVIRILGLLLGLVERLRVVGSDTSLGVFCLYNFRVGKPLLGWVGSGENLGKRQPICC
jgi:hypothetical protein